MKEFRVQIDVVFTGDLYITAKDEKQARELAKNKQLVPSDLKNFYMLDTKVLEVEEDEDSLEIAK